MNERSVRARVRVRWAVSLIAGIVTAALTVPFIGVAAGLLAGWGALSLVSVTWLLIGIWSMDAEATRAHATAEDPGRTVARFIAIAGSVISLGAVAVVIVQARSTSGFDAVLLAGIAVASIVCSWALIQANYLVHYARVYYEEGPNGEIRRGIDFNQSEDPQYTDFAYFSVGLGMTYQVADTDVTHNAVRRVVIAQTLLAYLFGAGILATVINLIAGLG